MQKGFIRQLDYDVGASESQSPRSSLPHDDNSPAKLKL